MAKIVHFEIPVDDIERAAAFYRQVLGWEMTSWGDQQYWLVRAGSEAEPGADGALIGRGGLHQHPVVIAGVIDIDAALAASVEHGGEVLQAKLPIPGMGWSSYFADPEGNTIGLFQVDPSAGGTPDAP